MLQKKHFVSYGNMYFLMHHFDMWKTYRLVVTLEKKKTFISIFWGQSSDYYMPWIHFVTSLVLTGDILPFGCFVCCSLILVILTSPQNTQLVRESGNLYRVPWFSSKSPIVSFAVTLQGGEVYLNLIHKYTDIHGMVDNSAPIPSYVMALSKALRYRPCWDKVRWACEGSKGSVSSHKSSSSTY